MILTCLCQEHIDQWFYFLNDKINIKQLMIDNNKITKNYKGIK